MASRYRIQIIDSAGDVVVSPWNPGLRVEQELVDSLCARIQAKGVGLGKTQSHVLEDVRAAINEYLSDVKALV